jgi:hypothetical protein
LAEKCHLGFASRMRSEHSASNPPSSFRRSIIPALRVAHRGSCASPHAIAQIARHGFKVPRAHSESFPNAAESGREIEFLTVDAGFEPY